MMSSGRWRLVLFSFVLISLTTPLKSQVFDEKFEHWPLETTIKGRILIDHGVDDLEQSQRILKRVVRKRRVVAFERTKAANKRLSDALREQAGDKGWTQSNPFDEIPAKKIAEALDTVDVVVLRLGAAAVGDLEKLRPLKKKINKLLRRNGSLIVDFETAQLLGKTCLIAGEFRPALDVLPGCLLLPQSHTTKESEKTQDPPPGIVGIRMAPKTMLMLSGRKMTCYGSGAVTFMISGCEFKDARQQTIRPRQQQRGQQPKEFLVDLTEWRRDAMDRTLERFPSEMPRTPHVARGALVIVGGGAMPAGLMQRFVDLAGGADKAKLVFIPCSERETLRRGSTRLVDVWREMEVKEATWIHTKDRRKAHTDPAFHDALKSATGIWFGGGRQWNFPDSYYGTETHRLMKDVLARGGVIGGSSAGASIQGRYLARATPIGNTEIMAPGYERGGLGFLDGVAIDQHFSQRNRQADLSSLVNRYPQLLGIGIDESTALVVKKSRAEVVGKGQVYFYDRKRKRQAGEAEYSVLKAGEVFDLSRREPVSRQESSTRAMSFNIRYDNKNDGKNRWALRQDLVIATITEFAPDLLGIQEALKSQVEFLTKNLKGYGFHGIGRRHDGTGEHVPIYYKLSRYRKVDGGHFWHSETPDIPGSKSWDSTLPRMVSWLRLEDKQNSGRQILVANTHFDHVGALARTRSAQLIRARLADANPATPIIVMGDFNAEEGSEPYQLLVARKGTTAGLIDSYRAKNPRPSDSEATFQRFTDSKKGKRIDWILHSQHWQTVEARINNTVRGGRVSSDHYPVETVLKLR